MNDNYTSLLEFLQILRKRRKVVMMVFVAIFGLSLIFSLFSTPTYEGAVQIIIEQVDTKLTGRTRDELRNPEFDKTQFQLIRSHAVARRVVSMLGLEKDPETFMNTKGTSFVNDLKKTLFRWVSTFVNMFRTTDEDNVWNVVDKWDKTDEIALELTKHLRVTPVHDSYITEVSYESPSPEFAAKVANTYIQAYLQEVLDMKMEATRRNLEWMTLKADSERLKLQAAEKSLQGYMQEHDLVALEDRATIFPEKLTQLGRDLVRVETRTKELKLLYDKVQGVSGNLNAAESVLSISEGSSLDVLRAQILRAEQSIMELSGKYGSKHPVMIKAVGDLNVLKRKRREEIHRIIEKVRGQYELSLSNEKSIRAQLEQTKAEALVMNEKYVEYSALKGEKETNRHLYDALLTKIKDQSITGETRPVNIWIVERAKVPPKPIKPNLVLNLALGLVLALGTGMGCAFLVNKLDNKIKSSEGVGEALSLPVLGSISFNQQAEVMSETLIKEPRSEYAENFNALRTMLLLSTSESPPKKILVTSSIAGEGKTSTAINLALTMAKAGSRVVLLDADMRKPSVHKIFKLHNSSGLSNYLTGEQVLSQSPHENLAVIPAGTIPPNPYELLNSNRIAVLLEKLEQEFDVIICDTPPVLSVADSRVLSSSFDGIILVARAGVTSYPMVRNCIKLLQDVNAHVLGLLVNAVHASDQEGYYRYYKSYFEEAEKPKSQKDGAASHIKSAVTQDS